LTLFILSGRELLKLAIMVLITTVLFGLAGLFSILIMQWMTLQSYAIEGLNKHGISEVKASRLGGVAIAVAVIISGVYLSMIGVRGDFERSYLGIFWPGWLAALGCFLLGLCEDIKNNSLSPKLRLASKTLILLLVFLWTPGIIASNIGVPGVDWLLGLPLVGLLTCLFFSVGFINAVNTVDGANGLVSGIFVTSCYIFSQEIGSLALIAGVYSVGVFFIFNVISGRLFLGDAGSYGLGAAMLIAALASFNLGLVSLPFLAALFFYPCVDFSVSILRRFLAGRSITAPDNDHLHNKVHAFFKSRLRSKNMANSLTGVSIAGGTSGLVLVVYVCGLFPANSNLWLWVFIAQCGLYGVVAIAADAAVRNARSKAIQRAPSPSN
jgi:UDP-GlcNAc:undecaprenyl-phosphate GlcNAc-1-phosphate transferase